MLDAKTIFEALDQDQRRVALHEPATGNVRVVAGAGAGKTTSIIGLASNLLSRGLSPRDIIITTFTAKAARELLQRLERAVGDVGLSVGTFHSLALRYLRELEPGEWEMPQCLDIGSTGRAPNVPAAGVLWAKVLGWDEIPGLNGAKGLNLENVRPRWYAGAVGGIRAEGIRVGTSEARVAARAVSRERELPELLQAWDLYEEAKDALWAWDFADVLDGLWFDHMNVGEDCSLGARVVIVDESQDNCRLDLSIATHLAKESLVLIGDARQAIFAFRGACPEIFQTADVELGAQTLELPTNYRSLPGIVDFGNAIAHEKDWALGVPAAPYREGEAEIRVLGEASDVGEQADLVAEEIADLLREGEVSAGEIAILCRTNAELGIFELALVRHRLPSSVVGGFSFWGRKETQDWLAYVKLAQSDDLEALVRIRNKPKRYLGKAFDREVQTAYSAQDLDDWCLVRAIRAAAQRVRGRGPQANARELAVLLERLRGLEWPEICQAVTDLLNQAQRAIVDGRHDTDEQGVYDACHRQALEFSSAEELDWFAQQCRDSIAVRRDDEEGDPNRVVISTVHRAKGLEWRRVYVSLTAGMFPHGNGARDEEERLFYVAATRARDALIATWSRRTLYDKPGGPSRFVDLMEEYRTDVPVEDAEEGAEELSAEAASNPEGI